MKGGRRGSAALLNQALCSLLGVLSGRNWSTKADIELYEGL